MSFFSFGKKETTPRPYELIEHPIDRRGRPVDKDGNLSRGSDGRWNRDEEPTDVLAVKAAVQIACDQVRTGRPNRRLTDLELSLSYSALLYWFKQSSCLRQCDMDSYLRFLNKYRTETSVLAGLSVGARIAEFPTIIAQICRKVPSFAPRHEVDLLRAIGIPDDTSDYMCNAIAVATMQLVSNLTRGRW